MRFRRLSGGFVRALAPAVLGAMLALAWGGGPANAQGEIFTVRGVAVDETAVTAAAARQAAIAAGQEAAFTRLVERLVPVDQRDRIPLLEPEQVESYVLDFSVNNERTSTVRYLAELTVRFNAEEIRALLRQNGVEFAETPSKPLLVLAVFTQEAGDPVLWLEPNPWREAWATRPLDDGLVPLRVPLGDLSDLAAIDAGRALAGDPDSLSAIAESYGASAVLVTLARLSRDPETAQEMLAVLTTRYEGGQATLTVSESVEQLADEPVEQFFARSAALVDSAVQEDWKRENILQFSNERSIVVFVPLGGLSDLLEVRRRIGSVAAIQNSSVSSLTRNQAELEVSFVGNEQRLTRALAQRDLFLSLREDSNWELTLPEESGIREETGGAAEEIGPEEPLAPESQ